MQKIVCKNNIGLDSFQTSCFNQTMNQMFLINKINEIWNFTKNKNSQHENDVLNTGDDEYRADMRGQFKKLRDRGLSIRIVTL